MGSASSMQRHRAWRAGEQARFVAVGEVDGQGVQDDVEGARWFGAVVPSAPPGPAPAAAAHLRVGLSIICAPDEGGLAGDRRRAERAEQLRRFEQPATSRSGRGALTGRRLGPDS